MERINPHEPGASDTFKYNLVPKKNFIVRGIVSETKTAQDKHKWMEMSQHCYQLDNWT